MAGPQEWRKSSFSNSNCLELFPGGNQVALRNSRELAAGALVFTQAEISAFLKGVKSGEFDDLIID